MITNNLKIPTEKGIIMFNNLKLLHCCCSCPYYGDVASRCLFEQKWFHSPFLTKSLNSLNAVLH